MKAKIYIAAVAIAFFGLVFSTVETLAVPIKLIISIERGNKREDCSGKGICIIIGVDVDVTALAGKTGVNITGKGEVSGGKLNLKFNPNDLNGADVFPVDRDMTLSEKTARALGFQSVVLKAGNYKIGKGGKFSVDVATKGGTTGTSGTNSKTD